MFRPSCCWAWGCSPTCAPIRCDDDDGDGDDAVCSGHHVAGPGPVPQRVLPQGETQGADGGEQGRPGPQVLRQLQQL